MLFLLAVLDDLLHLCFVCLLTFILVVLVLHAGVLSPLRLHQLITYILLIRSIIIVVELGFPRRFPRSLHHVKWEHASILQILNLAVLWVFLAENTIQIPTLGQPLQHFTRIRRLKLLSLVGVFLSQQTSTFLLHQLILLPLHQIQPLHQLQRPRMRDVGKNQ